MDVRPIDLPQKICHNPGSYPVLIKERIFILALLKDALSFLVVVPLVTISGLYFTKQLRAVQFRTLPLSLRLMSPKSNGAGISSFGAIAAVLGGNLGTGNIAGIAVALTTGGPGALFWMWIMAFLGAVLKYVGSYLGVRYRQTQEDGRVVGGPMHYLKSALGRPKLASLYCFLLIGGALTTGNMVQVNSLSLPLAQAGYSPFLMGLVMAVLLGATLLGGMKRFTHVVSCVVPFMAAGYLGACLYILWAHSVHILPAFETIFSSALGLSPALGGALGYGIFASLQAGFDRGLFATDAGLGLAAILHAPVNTPTTHVPSNAIAQGIMSVLSPLIVMCVCMVTGLVLMTTGAWQVPGLESTNQCMHAFCVGLSHDKAGFVVLVTLFFFAFTTVLTWSYCADRAVAFLFGEKRVRPFQVLFVALVPLGSLVSVTAAWQLADIFLAFMLLINVFALFALRKEVIEDTRAFLKNKG